MFFRPGIDPHNLPHHPFKAMVTPRPIAWVSSLDADGRVNLAPFSFFNGMSDDPPVVVVSIGWEKPGGERKDTLANIRATEEFVVNLVSAGMQDAMNATSAHLPAGEDEFAAAGLGKAPSELIAPPRVADAPGAFECRLVHAYDIAQRVGGYTAVFGEVVGIHIHPDAIKDGRFDSAGVQMLARMGYRDYSKVTEVFELKRPDANHLAEGGRR